MCHVSYMTNHKKFLYRALKNQFGMFYESFLFQACCFERSHKPIAEYVFITWYTIFWCFISEMIINICGILRRTPTVFLLFPFLETIFKVTQNAKLTVLKTGRNHSVLSVLMMWISVKQFLWYIVINLWYSVINA